MRKRVWRPMKHMQQQVWVFVCLFVCGVGWGGWGVPCYLCYMLDGTKAYVLSCSPPPSHTIGSTDGSVFVWSLDAVLNPTTQQESSLSSKKSTMAPQQLDAHAHKQTPVLCAAWSPVFAPMVSCDTKGNMVFWGDV